MCVCSTGGVNTLRGHVLISGCRFEFVLYHYAVGCESHPGPTVVQTSHPFIHVPMSLTRHDSRVV